MLKAICHVPQLSPNAKDPKRTRPYNPQQSTVTSKISAQLQLRVCIPCKEARNLPEGNERQNHCKTAAMMNPTASHHTANCIAFRKKRVLCMSWIAGKELFCKDEVRFRIVGGQYAWNYDLQLEDVGSSADCPRIQFCLALATHGNTHQFLLDLLEFVTTIQPKCKPKDIQGCWDLHRWTL